MFSFLHRNVKRTYTEKENKHPFLFPKYKIVLKGYFTVKCIKAPMAKPQKATIELWWNTMHY